MNPLHASQHAAAALAARWPAQALPPNKQVVAALATPPGAHQPGTVGITRWPQAPLPDERTPGRCALTTVRGYFDYAPAPPGSTAWWLNFADPDLFGFHETSLLAQDELQCLEIPLLVAARDALREAGHSATTAGSEATPVLVHGALRRVHLDTFPAPGRPWGLYGQAFARASAEQVRAAVSVLDPPVPVNVLAIAAPRGAGAYTAATIRAVLATAHAGFVAARAATQRAGGDPDRVVVHTGWWGCGAFGGNRELMALLQDEAADLAGLQALVFHNGEPEGNAPLSRARDVRSRLGAVGSVAGLIEALVARGYTWGVSNGT